MSIKVKDWEKFQHFKDRKPPWIKLYRDVLDDIQWHELSGDDAKMLVMLWLIASENEGELPPPKELAFRLRVTEKSIKSTVSKLSHWLRQDDIKVIPDNKVISPAYQDGVHGDIGGDISVKALTRSQETETERETETEVEPRGFEDFWKAYPKRAAKPAALKAFNAAKINGHIGDVLAHLGTMAVCDDWIKNGGKFIPYPATYLNQRRWEDDSAPGAAQERFV